MGNVILLFAMFVCLFVFVSGFIRKHFFSPGNLFGFVWAVILGSYIFKSEIYYEISVYSSSLLLFGILFFLLGTKLGGKKLVKFSEPVGLEPKILQTGLFLVLSIIAIVAFVEKAVINVGLLMTGLDFNEIYLLNINQDKEERKILLSIITSLIAGPMSFVVIPILGLELTLSKKRAWVILLSILIIILSILQNGRRSILIYIVPAIGFIFFFRKVIVKSIESKFKTYFFIVFTVAISISGILWLSNQRDTSVKDTSYIYLGGGVAGFSNRIEKVDKFYWGAGTMHGFLVPIMIGKKFYFGSYPEWWVKLDALVESADEIKIGPNEYMNAFTTMFYVPYIDFGPIGVLMISFLFGLFNGQIYRRMVYNSSILNLSTYSLLIVGFFGSMYTFYFTQTPYALSFFYIWLLFKNK